MKPSDDFFAVTQSDEFAHLLYLNNLFCSAAQEVEKRFAKRLMQNAKGGEGLDAICEMRIAAPRHPINHCVKICSCSKIGFQCGADRISDRIRRRPLQVTLVRKPQPRDAIRPYALPNSLWRAVPAKRLASVEDFAERRRVW